MVWVWEFYDQPFWSKRQFVGKKVRKTAKKVRKLISIEMIRTPIDRSRREPSIDVYPIEI